MTVTIGEASRIDPFATFALRKSANASARRDTMRSGVWPGAILQSASRSLYCGKEAEYRRGRMYVGGFLVAVPKKSFLEEG